MILLMLSGWCHNLAYGGNSEVYGAQLLLNTVHLDGEETQSIWAFNKAKEFARKVIVNEACYSRISRSNSDD